MAVTGPALQQVVAQLQATAAQAASKPDETPPEVNASQDSFASALAHSIDRIDALKQDAVAEGQAFESGQPGIGINNVMVDMQKAGLAFQMGIQVRNRVVSAYRDIMNMQV